MLNLDYRVLSAFQPLQLFQSCMQHGYCLMQAARVAI